MENRIKTLYIVTIIAILAFLGMQVYWLHGRYEFSLLDYERKTAERIEICVNDYNAVREKTTTTLKSSDADTIQLPTFSLEQQYGDSVKTKRTSKIYTYHFSANKLLGLDPDVKLSDTQKKQAVDLAKQSLNEPVDSVIFDVSEAKDENEAWIATKNFRTQRNCPFTVEGLDSILNSNGIRAQISLESESGMVWDNKVVYHTSVFAPAVTVAIPYSQLEGKTVSIVCSINPFDVLPEMSQALIITLLVSCVLIICLVLQFNTVLKLSRIDEMRNSFTTTMIHELKRPISTLKMCVSGLNNKVMTDDIDTRNELLTEMRAALDNLSAYFSKLRDITFNNVEQIPLNIQNVNLYELFDSVASAITIPADKNIGFNNRIDKRVNVSADRSHLYNIVSNLVENAVKYSGSSVEINADTTESNSFIELHICDTGNGISPADLKHIFKRFYRGRASAGEQPGMGLGLAYVKLLVDAHGGRISVESTDGKGTCFTIKLPQ